MQSEGPRGPVSTEAPPPVETPYAEPETEELHVHLPPLTIWPISAAAGITLAGGGLVTSPFISLLGVLILIWAIASWIQELRVERRHHLH